MKKDNLKSNIFVWGFLIILALGFFLSVSGFNFLTQKGDFVKWLSPDETSNYVFAKLYGQEGRMVIFEKYNLLVDDIMHPRSFRSDYGELKPVSFLGIILIYGGIIKFIGYKALPYLTPFFAAVGILYFYLLVKKIFGQSNALLSAFVLSFFPVYVYYSARSMFHNVLFAVLFLISLYYLLLSVQRRTRLTNNIFASLAGLFLGLAIITRSSELIWILPLLLFLWLWNIRKFGLIRLLLFLSFVFLGILPALYYNTSLYGAPFFGGYAEMNKSLVNISRTSMDIIKVTGQGNIHQYKNLFNELNKNIFYFGFQAKQSLWRFYYYFIKMFPLLFWPALAGGVYLSIEALYKKDKKTLLYIFSYMIVSVVLVAYYGSWGFNDNPDPNSYTIGNSYTRYWLPVYLGAIPMAVFALLKIIDLTFVNNLKQKKENKFFSFFLSFKFYKVGLIILSLIYLAVWSVFFVLFGSEEGLYYTAQNNFSNKKQFEQVINLTERNSAIITFYHDKLFFPERKVVVGLFDDKEMIKRYYLIAERLPLYYYNFTLGQKDIDYLNTRRLAEAGLHISLVKQINKDFSLYKMFIPDNAK